MFRGGFMGLVLSKLLKLRDFSTPKPIILQILKFKQFTKLVADNVDFNFFTHDIRTLYPINFFMQNAQRIFKSNKTNYKIYFLQETH